MATLDTNIILRGAPVNALASLSSGQQAGQYALDAQNQNQMRDMLQQQGPGILQGDSNSLAELARFDPAAATNIQAQQQAQEQARAAAERQAADRLAQMNSAQVAAEKQKLTSAIQAASTAQTPEQWDALATQFGAPELVGQFGQKDAVIQSLMDFDGFMDQYTSARTPLSPEGKLAADVANGLVDPSSTVDPKEVDSFRKEFSGLAAVKDFASQVDAYGRIVASATDPSAAGDLAMIFNFMKMLDPGSVVREGEFATAQNAAGIPDQVRNMYNRAISGERLGEEQRADFVGRAKKIYDSAEQNYSRLESQFKSTATQRGYDPAQAVIDYRYTGQEYAPPADPNNPPDMQVAPVDLSPEQIKTLSSKDFEGMDFSAMTQEQRAAARERLMQLVEEGAQ